MKFLIKEIKKSEDDPWDVITVKPSSNNVCKNCKKNARRDGSAYCIECAELNKKGRQ